MWYVGIDPSLTSMGVVVLNDRKKCVLAMALEIKKRKKGDEFFTAKVNIEQENKEFSFIKSVNGSRIPDVRSEIERILFVNNFVSTLLGEIVHMTGDVPVVGVEIPMGMHSGAGALIDRAYTAILLAFSDKVTAELGRKLLITDTPAAIKKFASGKGSAKKELVMKAVYKRWGFETEILDISDAYAIAQYAVERSKGNGAGKDKQKKSS